jgi:aminopeptidase N
VQDLGEARRWSFPDTPPLSTYNPVVNAGPFHSLRRDAGGHDLGIHARRSLAAVLERDADWIFEVTEQGLAFFGETFAMPFPQRTYDQVFLPELGGAMENYGCVSWSDAFLRRSTPTPAEYELFAKVLLHEMAHMWFGNIVTMRWWDDLWLNEAFAELACHWAAARATRYTDAWASHTVSERLGAYLADQGPVSHPIHQEIGDVAEAASIFDAITYPKGAAVLHQLLQYLGEETFARGMAAYFARHAWGNTTLADLMDALAAASGRDLDRWRALWLETAGPDRLTLRREGDRHVLSARGPASEPRPHLLAVGAYRSGADGLEHVGEVVAKVEGPETPLALPPADLYLVNDRDLTFATVRPDAASRATLLARAGELPSAVSRAVAVATVWDLLTNGEATAEEVVGCLTALLASETADAVVEPLVALACEAAELWAPDTSRQRLLAEVARTCRAVAEDPTRRRVALRGLAASGSLEDVDWLQDHAGDDADLRWRALVRKAEVGQVEDAEIEALLDADADPDAWVRALGVRVARPTADAKAEFWTVAVEGRKVPVGSFTRVAAAFWRPAQDELLAPYAEDYLRLLPGLDEAGMIPAMVYAGRLFPVFGVGPDFLDRAVDAAAGSAPVVRTTLLGRADLVRRMLRSRDG